jgi:glutamine synthetase
MDPTMGDLLAIPDPSTLTPLPWRPEVGWLSCNLVHNGVDLDHGPRNVLRKVVAGLEKEGLAMKIGVECEFFLLEAPGPNDKPGSAPKLGDRLDTQGKPCYDAHALMRRWPLTPVPCSALSRLPGRPFSPPSRVSLSERQFPQRHLLVARLFACFNPSPPSLHTRSPPAPSPPRVS